MSSAPGSSSPTATTMDQDEPRKKGARGGKRSVTHLSKAQLARKRANDREAQRNIRQRTKEHIENLERKVKELEQHARAGSMERVLARNRELETEIEKLRAQLTAMPTTPSSACSNPREMPDEMMISQKAELDWMPGSTSSWAQTSLPSHIPSLQAEVAVSASYMNDSSSYHTAPAMSSHGYADDETEAGQPIYTQTQAPQAIPTWDDPMMIGSQAPQSQSLSKPAWSPFHPAFSQPSRFADVQESGYPDASSNHNPSYPTAASWHSQPPVYAWQLSTKLKAPASQVDHLMMSAIHSQRHMTITTDLSGKDLIGSDLPPVHLLFDQPGPAKPHTSLTEVMARKYAAVLSNRGFALIPEKLASFMCMYRFVQWQIDPSYNTYQRLHEWQAPRPSQLLIAHPAWMDLPPWGKFREKIIENQERYDNNQFQHDYVTNLNVNFPDPMAALVFEDGQIRISSKLDRHLSDIRNITMKKPFCDKYPEFRDACQFEEG